MRIVTGIAIVCPETLAIDATPELQLQGFIGGCRNYSIFERADGLLFLYSELDEAVAERAKLAGLGAHSAEGQDVNERWQTMMNKVGLDRDWEFNGELEHVMYIGRDRVMK